MNVHIQMQKGLSHEIGIYLGQKRVQIIFFICLTDKQQTQRI